MSHFTLSRGQLQPTLDQNGLPLTLQLHIRIMSRFMPKCNLMTVGHIFRTGQRCLQAKWESKDRTLPETNSTGNATTQNFLMWLEVMVITNLLMFNKFRLKVLNLQLSKTIRVHSSSLCFQDFFFHIQPPALLISSPVTTRIQTQTIWNHFHPHLCSSYLTTLW